MGIVPDAGRVLMCVAGVVVDDLQCKCDRSTYDSSTWWMCRYHFDWSVKWVVLGLH